MGRPGTEEFVPGHFFLPLSRDNGTPGQDFFLSRDVPRDVPSLGNTNPNTSRTHEPWFARPMQCLIHSSNRCRPKMTIPNEWDKINSMSRVGFLEDMIPSLSRRGIVPYFSCHNHSHSHSHSAFAMFIL